MIISVTERIDIEITIEAEVEWGLFETLVEEAEANKVALINSVQKKNTEHFDPFLNKILRKDTEKSYQLQLNSIRCAIE